MDIDEEQLQKFIALYKKEYDVDLTHEQVREEATKLFRLYCLVYLGK